jgi:hypothetical protein
MTTQEKIKYYLSLCNNRQCVEFALHCAKATAKSSGVKDETVERCIGLVEKWLANPTEVSNLEFSEAASSASHAAYAASHAASSAAYAAYAASHAAYAASHAAYAASHAAYAASHASHAASSSASYEDKRKEQLTHLLTNILKSNAFDKLMADV